MPEMTDAFAVTAKAKGPLDENCFSKVAANHPLKHSETKVNVGFQCLRHLN